MSKILRYAFELGLLILLAAAAVWVNSEKESGDEPKREESAVPDSAIPVTYAAHIDGDTTIFLSEGQEIRVRYLAVDTPESVSRNEEKPNTDMGETVSEYVKGRLEEAEEICLEFDEKSDETDKYGRTLAWIWLDGSLFQLELVEKGYADVRYVYGDYKYLDQLYDAQERAKRKKLGIWAEEQTAFSSEYIRGPAICRTPCRIIFRCCIPDLKTVIIGMMGHDVFHTTFQYITQLVDGIDLNILIVTKFVQKRWIYVVPCVQLVLRYPLFLHRLPQVIICNHSALFLSELQFYSFTVSNNSGAYLLL